MALVACPECGQQISTAASSCPHCGRPSGIAVAQNAAPWPGVVSAGAAAAVPAPEQSLWQGGPSIALLYGQILRLIIRLLVLVVIGYFAIAKGLPALASSSSDVRSFVEAHGNDLRLAIIGLLTLALIPSVFALLMAAARNKATHYRVTNQRIIIESGLFSRSLDEIDMRSVDDIEFRQSFLERIFGIGEIVVVSTDKVAPRRTLHGIHDPRNMRELIRATAYQLTQRQLFTRST
jgi:membrane protein YdbS with pleckstrin-like domain